MDDIWPYHQILSDLMDHPAGDHLEADLFEILTRYGPVGHCDGRISADSSTFRFQDAGVSLVARYSGTSGLPVPDRTRSARLSLLKGSRAWDLDHVLACRLAHRLARWDRAHRTTGATTMLATPQDLTDWAEHHRFSRWFSWAPPTVEALREAADHGPLVVIEAASGYWAALLGDRGVTVTAYDRQPDPALNPGFDRTWGTVLQGDVDALRGHEDRTLMLVRPPDPDVPARALRAFRGDKLVYVGRPVEHDPASSGFCALLDLGWEEVRRIALPRWQVRRGPGDFLFVFRRLPGGLT